MLKKSLTWGSKSTLHYPQTQLPESPTLLSNALEEEGRCEDSQSLFDQLKPDLKPEDEDEEQLTSSQEAKLKKGRSKPQTGNLSQGAIHK